MTEIHPQIQSDLIKRADEYEKFIDTRYTIKEQCEKLIKQATDIDIQDFYYSEIDKTNEKVTKAYEFLDKILGLLPPKVYIIEDDATISSNEFPINDFQAEVKFKAFDKNNNEITDGDMYIKNSIYNFKCRYIDGYWFANVEGINHQAVVLFMQHFMPDDEYNVKLLGVGDYFTFEPNNFTIYYKDDNIPDITFKAFDVDEDEYNKGDFVGELAGFKVVFKYDEDDEKYHIFSKEGEYERLDNDTIMMLSNQTVQKTKKIDGRDVWDRDDLDDYCKDHKDDEIVTIENVYFKGSIADFHSRNIESMILKNCVFSNAEGAFNSTIRKHGGTVKKLQKIVFRQCKVEGNSCKNMFGADIIKAHQSKTNKIIRFANTITANVKRCFTGVNVTGLNSADVRAENIMNITGSSSLDINNIIQLANNVINALIKYDWSPAFSSFTGLSNTIDGILHDINDLKEVIKKNILLVNKSGEFINSARETLDVYVNVYNQLNSWIKESQKVVDTYKNVINNHASVMDKLNSLKNVTQERINGLVDKLNNLNEYDKILDGQLVRLDYAKTIEELDRQYEQTLLKLGTNYGEVKVLQANNDILTQNTLDIWKDHPDLSVEELHELPEVKKIDKQITKNNNQINKYIKKGGIEDEIQQIEMEKQFHSDNYDANQELVATVKEVKKSVQDQRESINQSILEDKGKIQSYDEQIVQENFDYEQARTNLNAEEKSLKKMTDSRDKIQKKLDEGNGAVDKVEETNVERQELIDQQQDELNELEKQKESKMGEYEAKKKHATVKKVIMIAIIITAAIIITCAIIHHVAKVREEDEYRTNLMTVDLTGLDTSKVTNMSMMFNGVITLTGVKFINTDGTTLFNTSKVQDFSSMFFNCEAMRTIDLSSLSFALAENLVSMFEDCSSLETIGIGNIFEMITKVVNMENMFRSCSSLVSFDFNTTKQIPVSSLASCFENCTSLTNIVNLFTTSDLKSISKMCSNCSGLVAVPVDLTGINTSNVLYMDRVFESCTNTLFLKISFDTSKAITFDHMFDNCVRLLRIFTDKDFVFNSKAIKNKKINDVFTNCRCLVGGKGYEWNQNSSYNEAKTKTQNQNGLFTRIVDMDVFYEPLLHMEDYTETSAEDFSIMIETYAGDFGLEKVVTGDQEINRFTFEKRMFSEPLNFTYDEYEFVDCIFICQYQNYKGLFADTMFGKLIFRNCLFFGSMSYMFRNCFAAEIQFIDCDTRYVPAYEETFRGIMSQKLDLSGLKTKYADSMYKMFADAEILKTIVVSTNFDTSRVPDDEIIFENDPKLEGASGFKFSSTCLTKKYAVVNIASNKGYFTPK